MAELDKLEPGQSAISKIKVKKLKPLNVNIASDERTCAVWGMALATDGTSVLMDASNLNIKLYETGGKLISSQKFSNALVSVALINDSRAVVCTRVFKDDDDDILGVSGYSYDELQFLDISNPSSVAFQRNVSVDFTITHIAVIKDNLVLGTYKMDEDGTACVKMMDLNGLEIWSADHDDKGECLFERAEHVAGIVFNCKAAVLVSDPVKNSLVVLDAASGKLMKQVDVGKKGPHGITTDKEGNIYVCYWSTTEIGVWSPDLEKSTILLTGGDLQSSPKIITYDKASDELYVSYSKSTDFIDRFHLE